jgi:hypothetical protein
MTTLLVDPASKLIQAAVNEHPASMENQDRRAKVFDQ